MHELQCFKSSPISLHIPILTMSANLESWDYTSFKESLKTEISSNSFSLIRLSLDEYVSQSIFSNMIHCM